MSKVYNRRIEQLDLSIVDIIEKFDHCIIDKINIYKKEAGELQKLDPKTIDLANIVKQVDDCRMNSKKSEYHYNTDYFATRWDWLMRDERPCIADPKSKLYCQIWIDKKEVIISNLDKHPFGDGCFRNVDKLRANNFFYDGTLIDALHEFKERGYKIYSAEIPPLLDRLRQMVKKRAFNRSRQIKERTNEGEQYINKNEIDLGELKSEGAYKK